MSWETVCLSEIIKVVKGKYITKKEAKEGPYPVILGGREPAYYIDKFNHAGKAIVVSRSGASAGYVSYWNEPIFVTDGFLIEPTETINFDFLYYLMKSKEKQLIGLQGGSAIPHVTPKTIGGIDILLPSIETQHRIADILSTYDNLIENNQKQIKLLEEAAQRLYKEWFVDLHFPGYEDTEIVDGVPEGWIVTTIDSFIELKSGFAFKSSTFVDNGKYKVVTIKNVQDGRFDGENVNTVSDIPSKMPVHCKLQDGDMLLSLTGNVGRICVVNGSNYLLNQRVAKLVSQYPCFTYCLFKSDKLFLDLNNLANGAAQQNLSPIRTGQISIIKPNDNLLVKYESVACTFLSKIMLLSRSIRLYQQARDRLLPKLMSGELEV